MPLLSYIAYIAYIVWVFIYFDKDFCYLFKMSYVSMSNYLIPVNFLLFFLSIHKTYLLWLVTS
jgi:hypothetical protein